jgi:hypothetical protein
MYGDAYRDMTHYEMQQYIWRRVAPFAEYADIERRIANGRKADVYYQVGRTTVIVEVKTLLKDSLIESAWNKYSGYCDYLAIACPPQLCYQDYPPLLSGWHKECLDRIGIWWVEWHGLTEIRPAARLDVETPGVIKLMSRALSPFAVIASPGCTAPRP